MNVQVVVTVSLEDWKVIRRVLVAVRALHDAAEEGGLRGAVSPATDQGIKLAGLLREIHLSAKELPDLGPDVYVT